jgi:hypothetical protein
MAGCAKTKNAFSLKEQNKLALYFIQVSFKIEKRYIMI